MTAQPHSDETETAESRDVFAISENVAALARGFVRTRTQVIANAAPDYAGQWWAQLLLQNLAAEGPMRSSALAEVVQSDPSTVSRQIATLVKDGLVERRADPGDGRASLLVLTEKGVEVAARHSAARRDWFAGVVEGWNPADVARFAELLTQFVQQFSAASAQWLDEVPKAQQ